jgi:hypothetical protein
MKPRKVKTTPNQHQDKISEAFFLLITKNKKVPTVEQLAEAASLPIETVESYLKDSSFEQSLEVLKAMSSMMLVQFANRCAKSSNPKLWRMYFMMTEPGYGRRKK